jgi:hypothetical protein
MASLLLFIITLSFTPSNIIGVVEEFHNLNSRKAERDFIKNYQESADPSILGYVLAIEMKQSEYSYNPLKKFKTFDDAKKKLNNLIERNPNDIHLRYVRLVLQEKSPKFLGYKDFIEQDKGFLIKKLEIVDDSDFLDIYIHNYTSL